MVGLNGSLLHRLERVEQLVPVVTAPPQALEDAVWQSWPVVVRCYLETVCSAARNDDVRTWMHLEHLVGLAVTASLSQNSHAASFLLPMAAAILREQVELETWRLIHAHPPPRVWSYGCWERQEAATTLLGVDAADLHTLDDDALLRAFLQETITTAVNLSDVLEPAALRVLEAAYSGVGLDACPHAGGHDQVPRHVRADLERALASFRIEPHYPSEEEPA